MSTKREGEENLKVVAAATSEGGSGEVARDHGDPDDIGLDLEGLDLTVETVEERISPSETNVFDK